MLSVPLCIQRDCCLCMVGHAWHFAWKAWMGGWLEAVSCGKIMYHTRKHTWTARNHQLSCNRPVATHWRTQDNSQWHWGCHGYSTMLPSPMCQAWKYKPRKRSVMLAKAERCIHFLTYRYFNRNAESVGSQLETTKSIREDLNFMSKHYFEQYLQTLLHTSSSADLRTPVIYLTGRGRVHTSVCVHSPTRLKEFFDIRTDSVT